jgi:hypothetical protein
MWREEMTGEPCKHHAHDNVMSTQGNSKSYTVSRLKRERPDLFKRVVDKELSANAAAIEAGWRKKLSDLEQALRFYERLSPQERVEFFAKIGKP